MKLTVSNLALIIANTIPILGVIFFGWDLFQIIFLYWLESGVIGFYNIIKMIVISPKVSLFFVPFFIIHYGGFMAGHLMFILFIFTPGNFFDKLSPFGDIFNYVLPAGTFLAILFPLITLFISHGISFFTNFIGKKEYGDAGLIGKQMGAPYVRIFLMQFTIIFGGILSLILGTPIVALIMLITLKTIVDLFFHLREHSKSVL